VADGFNRQTKSILCWEVWEREWKNEKNGLESKEKGKVVGGLWLGQKKVSWRFSCLGETLFPWNTEKNRRLWRRGGEVRCCKYDRGPGRTPQVCIEQVRHARGKLCGEGIFGLPVEERVKKTQQKARKKAFWIEGRHVGVGGYDAAIWD